MTSVARAIFQLINMTPLPTKFYIILFIQNFLSYQQNDDTHAHKCYQKQNNWYEL